MWLGNLTDWPSSPESQLEILSFFPLCLPAFHANHCSLCRFVHPFQMLLYWIPNIIIHHDPHQYRRRRHHHHHHHFLHHKHCRDLHSFQMLLFWIPIFTTTTAIFITIGIAEICTPSKCCSIELPPLLSQWKSTVRWKVECQRLKQALTFGPQGGGSFSFVFVHALNTTKGKSLKKCESESPAYWDNVSYGTTVTYLAKTGLLFCF